MWERESLRIISITVGVKLSKERRWLERSVHGTRVVVRIPVTTEEGAMALPSESSCCNAEIRWLCREGKYLAICCRCEQAIVEYHPIADPANLVIPKDSPQKLLAQPA